MRELRQKLLVATRWYCVRRHQRKKPFMSAKEKLTLASRVMYEIRVQGALDDGWKGYLKALTIEVQRRSDEAPVTFATCEFIDQAELVGALSYVHDMGLPLLSVTCISIEADAPA